MISRVQMGSLQVAQVLLNLVNDKILPGTEIPIDHFWRKLEAIVDDLSPKNRALLHKRDELQTEIDQWHVSQNLAHQKHDSIAYKQFLTQIGYLIEEGSDFTIETEHVDSEIVEQAGPQLVVPLKNARFALNATNARWGSLYDALYGTDAINEEGGAEIGSAYNPVRGHKVIAFAKQHLDQLAPLTTGSHSEVHHYQIANNQLLMTLIDGDDTGLVHPEKFIGFTGDKHSPTTILLKNNGLHVEIQIDKAHRIGNIDLANVKDLLVEAAVTTIMDCEDSIAAVDAEDKCEVYENWLGLMRGTLSAQVHKEGQHLTRQLHQDREYDTPVGGKLTLPGRSLLFIRNVGHLMTNNAILDRNGDEIPEGILDGMITVLAALHDLQGNNNGLTNSRMGSIYIVKPKMHGPEEVAFTCELFTRIEDALKLSRYTIKLGIMDEERRTTVNLKECIRAAKERVVFINTGFLDRTGDEIHTSMLAGPFVPKSMMKQQAWINAYEDWNVDIGLACGLSGRAQIGKGMWAMPDEMAKMLDQKVAHPKAGANTAWVPSPNAASLHSIHYHQVNVSERQQMLATRKRASLDNILTIPLIEYPITLIQAEIERELDNNAQGILGYVVRWIDQGIGCSKVPDINDIALMEDRATLRISSQYIANWLEHGICTKAQVIACLKRMAVVVDNQNVTDPEYQNMAPSFNGIAFNTAADLIFKGKTQPSGYTEPLLHAYRIQAKAR